MGPRDPFASSPPPATPGASAAPAGSADGADSGPVRITARMPEPKRPAPVAGRERTALLGAAIGLVVATLAIVLTAGELLIVLICTLLGAALGVIVKGAFPGGVDVEAAWRALKR